MKQTILAIETSCDETAIAVLEINSKPKILSNIIASQIKIHQKYGGVFPALAKREHQKNLLPVLIKSLKAAKILKAKSRLQRRRASPKFIWAGAKRKTGKRRNTYLPSLRIKEKNARNLPLLP